MATGTRAGRREWVGLAVLALPTLLVSLDVFVLILALPKLAVSLHADGTEQLWIMDTYGFMVAGFMVTMGTLGDRIGRRKLLLIGATAFGLASVVAAFSTSAAMLIGARAVLGIAGATLAPSTLALIGTMFTDPRQRASAIGIWAGCFSVGAIIGPVVGGFLLEHFWWGSVFLLGVPAMVLLLVIGPKLLPEYRDETRRPPRSAQCRVVARRDPARRLRRQGARSRRRPPAAGRGPGRRDRRRVRLRETAADARRAAARPAALRREGVPHRARRDAAVQHARRHHDAVRRAVLPARAAPFAHRRGARAAARDGHLDHQLPRRSRAGPARADRHAHRGRGRHRRARHGRAGLRGRQSRVAA